MSRLAENISPLLTIHVSFQTSVLYGGEITDTTAKVYDLIIDFIFIIPRHANHQNSGHHYQCGMMYHIWAKA